MTSTTVSRTFAVSDVRPATEPLAELPFHEVVTEFLATERIEACSQYHGQLVADAYSHPLIAALHLSFAEHRSVCLSPDIIWLTILQGLAHHVNSDAEGMRRHFVRHDGKLKIKVFRDDFVKGSPENPWSEVLATFSERIREHIGNAHEKIVADFSTTGIVERTASEVALLDTMQAFFTYEFITRCGIPLIQLEGTVDDWRQIARRVEGFRSWGLDWWIDQLNPILTQFVAAAGDRVDRIFWESIYKWTGPDGSGSPFVSGWILNFFPYLNNPKARFAGEWGIPADTPALLRNEWLGSKRADCGPNRDSFPALPSKAPFKWKYLNVAFDMEFVGGLIGVRQDEESLCLKPEIGWAVLDVTPRADETSRKDV